MVNDKKPLYWMILFGIVRAALIYGGTKLEQHGLIDPDTKERLVSEGVSEVVGYLCIALGVLWSVLQKTQVFAWILAAIDARPTATPADALKDAPGPDMPV